MTDEGPFERYFDEYYKLDCEDVIGDVKCRFGYRKAKRCTYGLTVDEVSLALQSTLHFSRSGSSDNSVPGISLIEIVIIYCTSSFYGFHRLSNQPWFHFQILMADDKELNQWYSFKKMMKYRYTLQSTHFSISRLVSCDFQHYTYCH